nr:hypothetical protein [Candidatus Woesearchaeota archaeon]
MVKSNLKEGELIKKIKDIFKDKRLVLYLTPIGSNPLIISIIHADLIINEDKRKKHLTEYEKSELEKTCQFYERIRKLNSGFNMKLRRDIYSLADEISTLSELNLEYNEEEIKNARFKAVQILNKEYFWHIHLLPSQRLLSGLKKEILVDDLEAKMNTYFKQVYLI